jgi:hypothetical protein
MGYTKAQKFNGMMEYKRWVLASPTFFCTKWISENTNDNTRKHATRIIEAIKNSNFTQTYQNYDYNEQDIILLNRIFTWSKKAKGLISIEVLQLGVKIVFWSTTKIQNQIIHIDLPMNISIRFKMSDDENLKRTFAFLRAIKVYHYLFYELEKQKLLNA